MTEPPTQLPAIEAQVYDIEVTPNNGLRARLVFNDGTWMSLELPPGSPATHDLLELLGRAANDLLQRLGQRGIALTGFTPEEEEAST